MDMMVEVGALDRVESGVSVLSVLVHDLITELGSFGSNTSTDLAET